MVKAFDKGDIVLVSLNPTEGRELKGVLRPCLVLSPKQFNVFGNTLVAPISQGGEYARIAGFTVSLTGLGMQTQGVVLLNSIRMLDLKARKGTKIEEAPLNIVNEATAILNAILA